jgi:hypothetical protein
VDALLRVRLQSTPVAATVIFQMLAEEESACPKRTSVLVLGRAPVG